MLAPTRTWVMGIVWVIIVTVWGAAGECNQAHFRPLLTVWKARSGITVDGQLDEPDWTRAEHTSSFTCRGSSPKAPHSTVVRLLYDQQHLYVAFQASFSCDYQLHTTVSAHDHNVWKDDCVEMFLDTNLDRTTYAHIVVNSAGVVYDAYHSPSKREATLWESQAQVASCVQPGYWVVEIAIPFCSLNSAPAPGVAWGLQLARVEKTPPFALATWPPDTSGNFHRPKQFGLLSFNFASVRMTDLKPPDKYWYGTNSMGVTLYNRAPRKMVVSPHLIVEGPDGSRTLKAEAVQLDPKEEVKVDLRLPLRREGDYRLRMELWSVDGQRLACSERLSFHFDPLGIGAVAQRLAELRTTEAVPSVINGELDRISQLIDQTRNRAIGQSGQERSVLRVQVSDIEQRLNATVLRSQARQLRGYSQRRLNYVVGCLPTTQKVFCDEPYNGPVVDKVQMSMARREWQSCQLIVIPLQSDLQQVRVTVSPLANDAGQMIPAEHISVNPIGYVRTVKPPYDTVKVGLWPDPFLPNEPFSVSRNRLQPVWVTVRTRPSTQPGDYHGTVTIAPTLKEPLVIPLTIHVWDFELPAASHMKSAFNINAEHIWARYVDGGLNYWGPALLPYFKRFMRPLKESRLGTFYSHSFNAYVLTETGDTFPHWDLQQPLDFTYALQAMDFLLRGDYSGYIQILYLDKREPAGPGYSKSYVNGRMNYLDQLMPILREKGVVDHCIVYGWDEIPSHCYWMHAQMAKLIRSKYPELKIALIATPDPTINDYVDIWIPWVFQYNNPKVRQELEQRRAAGDELWWYTCVYNIEGPRRCPVLNIDVDGMDPRILSWMAWKQGVTGYLYWGATHWRGQYRDESGHYWPQVEWVCSDGNNGFCGDGFVLYPGPDGQPLFSVRLANFRDGVEDYDYFWILGNLVQQAKASLLTRTQQQTVAEAAALLDIPDEICMVANRWTQDDQLLVSYRQQLAQAITTLKQYTSAAKPSSSVVP